MRLGDLDALSAFVGDLRSTLHKEQSTFKAMTQSEFEIKDNMLLNFQYAIDNAPTVEPQRTHGEWYYNYQNGWHCSICHESVKDMPTVMGKADFNFCPNCGVKMKGGEVNEDS